VWPSSWWWRRLCPDGRHFGALVTDWLELPRQCLFVVGEGDGLWNKRVPKAIGWWWLGWMADLVLLV